MFDKCFSTMPLVAILRGVQPHEAEAIGESLIEAGFRMIEVPLNSPDPLQSIEILAKKFGDIALIGAGTVLSPQAVEDVENAGGRLIVMPHADLAVIRAAKQKNLYCTPGVMTPTEGFAALNAGADALKLFPAELLPPSAVKAVLSVYPKNTRLLPVGGITPNIMADYLAAGAAGFGLGSALYKIGDNAQNVALKAKAFVESWTSLQKKSA